jgi:hypothetical protein
MEVTSNAVQLVGVGQNVLFTESPVPCNKGYVIHREGSGILTLRGIVNNPCATFARYLVSFGANIAVPADTVEAPGPAGTPGEIGLALAIDGEPVPTSEAVVTPTATGAYFGIFESLYVTVPRGCCYTIAVENISDQAIDVRNANLIVERVA